MADDPVNARREDEEMAELVGKAMSFDEIMEVVAEYAPPEDNELIVEGGQWDVETVRRWARQQGYVLVPAKDLIAAADWEAAL